jgi:hypothetical protein
MNKTYYAGDRFIQGNSDLVAHNFGTKAQLFADQGSDSHSDGRFNVNNSDNSQENLQFEENRKTFTALL